MSQLNAAVTYTARWIFPVDAPPLPGGSVSVRGDRIFSVQAAGARRADIDLGNVALLPGFVNAHTHLDLSGAGGLCPPSADFTAWLRQVIAFRRQRTPAQVQLDIAAGIRECVRFGTTLVGDISSDGASWTQLAEAPLRATVYYELLGLTKERAAQSWQQAQRWLAEHPATATCRPGLSPHAPYSVRRELFETVARYAGAHEVPVAIHLAETLEEKELLEQRTGIFVEFLRELGAWDPNGLVAGADELQDLFRQVSPILMVHGNHLPKSWREESSHAVCPRTHAAFGRGPLPLELATALGTDSLASNPDFDILAEARFVYPRMRQQREGSSWLLKDLTIGGAGALGWHRETGTLTPGKSADLVVLPLPDRAVADPHDLIFDSDLAIESVMFRGHWSPTGMPSQWPEKGT